VDKVDKPEETTSENKEYRLKNKPEINTVTVEQVNAWVGIE